MKFIQVSFSKLASAVRLGVLSGVLWGAKNAIELGPWAKRQKHGTGRFPRLSQPLKKVVMEPQYPIKIHSVVVNCSVGNTD